MARTEANVGVIEGVGRKGEDDVRACLMVPARWDERGSAEINRTSERFEEISVRNGEIFEEREGRGKESREITSWDDR